MRKTLEAGTLGLLAVLCWITYSALNGPGRLPDRIPTHFDISGQPNAWGEPSLLWILPVVACALYLLMTVLGSIRFGSYSLPAQNVTAANLPMIQEKTGLMVAWVKLEMLSLFTYIQWAIIEGARAGEFHLSPWIVPVFMAAVFVTAGWHVVMMIRGVKARAESFGEMSPVKNSR